MTRVVRQMGRFKWGLKRKNGSNYVGRQGDMLFFARLHIGLCMAAGVRPGAASEVYPFPALHLLLLISEIDQGGRMIRLENVRPG